MSNIDPTKPEEGQATTASVRENFATAKEEIEALQAVVSFYAMEMEAGEALGGHRIVRGDGAGKAFYADRTELSHEGQVIGMTTGAASLGAPVTVCTSGKFTEPSWNWAPGPVYLGTSGGMTQEVPTSGILQEVGVALAPTVMVVELKQSIILEE